jgi:hypothetical protein
MPPFTTGRTPHQDQLKLNGIAPSGMFWPTMR